jgi:Cu(I)/Ag(I) efflux system membrane fusion protein
MWNRKKIVAAAAAALLGGAAVWSTGRTGLGHTARADPAVQAQYRCPMHPSYVSERPGTCPICGMKLVGFASRPAVDTPPSAPAPVADRAALTLSAEERRGLGLRSEPVRRTALARTIRTVGRVTPDERRLHHVHTKFEAYVERLHVDFTGKFVRKGQPLASLYSPDLVASQHEYLLAARAQRQLSASALPAVAQGGVDLLEAARRRLLLWDVRAADIARLEATGEVRRTLDLYSPVSGYVTQKMALHGMRVTPADSLFDIVDLSRLWILADVYEADLALVRPAMPATLTSSYLPGRVWRGAVTYIAPVVEEKTRTIKVRVEVENADGQLKPDMFADVMLESALGTGLVVPESALLRTGERTLVFTDVGEGRLEPREVQVGTRVANGVQVVGGLAEGERVVTAANFLLDSESRLKAALSALSPGPAPAGPHTH